jgi:hypothetical protein
VREILAVLNEFDSGELERRHVGVAVPAPPEADSRELNPVIGCTSLFRSRENGAAPDAVRKVRLSTFIDDSG